MLIIIDSKGSGVNGSDMITESNSRLDKIPKDYFFEDFFKEVAYQGSRKRHRSEFCTSHLISREFCKECEKPKKSA